MASRFAIYCGTGIFLAAGAAVAFWQFNGYSKTETYLLASEADLSMEASLLEIEELQRSEGVLAFPGALGYGRHSKGGRGGQVVIVNTVNDLVDPSDTYISLREAIEEETGPRTVVFSVGGVFDTGAAPLDLLGEDGSNLTVACQSAPSPGVNIKTVGFNLQNGVHDVIFRHCTVRGIDPGPGFSEASRGATVRGGSENIIFDHMSISWFTDEGFQAYLSNSDQTGLRNITLSNSIVAEGDADSSHKESIDHPDWGYHAMGPSCLNNNNDLRPANCSIVNNYIAHNSSRNAMIWGGSGELSNNIIYNWFGLGLTARTYFGSNVDVHINNNLMKPGPDTRGSTSNPTCGPDYYRCAMAVGSSDEQGLARYSVGVNYYYGSDGHLPKYEVIENPLALTSEQPNFKAATPSTVKITDMVLNGSRHMKCIGASKPVRDAVDTRVIQEFYDKTGSIGIGDNNRKGGHNVTEQRTWTVFGGAATWPPNHDQDKDGMPDEWEKIYGLNPGDPNDHATDLDNDGYTNLEEYLALAAHC